MSNGNSHNLMKIGSKRRRIRYEIQQQKLEEVRARMIEAKLQRFEEMEEESRRVQEVGGIDNVMSATEVLNDLKKIGMLKIADDGSFITPNTLT